MKTIQGNIYRLVEAGKQNLVRARKPHGALAEVREPKKGYRLTQANNLKRVRNQSYAQDVFSMLDR